MTLILNIHGRDYPVPRELEPEPALCAAFDAAIRTQLEEAALLADIPQSTVHCHQFTADGNYQLAQDGTPVTVAKDVWLDLPPELHDQVIVPTAADILAAET